MRYISLHFNTTRIYLVPAMRWTILTDLPVAYSTLPTVVRMLAHDSNSSRSNSSRPIASTTLVLVAKLATVVVRVMTGVIPLLPDTMSNLGRTKFWLPEVCPLLSTPRLIFMETYLSSVLKYLFYSDKASIGS
jgi:hypothetical protein